MLVAKVSGLKVGTFTHQIGNLHYYDHHEDVLLEQLNLLEYEQPNIYIKDTVSDFLYCNLDGRLFINIGLGKVFKNIFLYEGFFIELDEDCS